MAAYFVVELEITNQAAMGPYRAAVGFSRQIFLQPDAAQLRKLCVPAAPVHASLGVTPWDVCRIK